MIWNSALLMTKEEVTQGILNNILNLHNIYIKQID